MIAMKKKERMCETIKKLSQELSFCLLRSPLLPKNRPPWKFSNCPKINQKARNIRISKLTFEYSKIFEYQTWYSNVCEYSNIKINIRIFAIIRISKLTFEWSQSNVCEYLNIKIDIRIFEIFRISKLTIECSQLNSKVKNIWEIFGPFGRGLEYLFLVEGRFRALI